MIYTGNFSTYPLGTCLHKHTDDEGVTYTPIKMDVEVIEKWLRNPAGYNYDDAYYMLVQTDPFHKSPLPLQGSNGQYFTGIEAQEAEYCHLAGGLHPASLLATVFPDRVISLPDIYAMKKQCASRKNRQPVIW